MIHTHTHIILYIMIYLCYVDYCSVYIFLYALIYIHSDHSATQCRGGVRAFLRFSGSSCDAKGAWISCGLCSNVMSRIFPFSMQSASRRIGGLAHLSECHGTKLFPNNFPNHPASLRSFGLATRAHDSGQIMDR